MKSKITLLIFSILLLSTISANIVITPQNEETTVEVQDEITKQVDIFNNFTFDIMDFTFPELQEKGFTFTNQNITIPSNTSRTLIYKVKTTESFFGTINAKVEFKFLVDLPETPQTYNIQITENGFNPKYLTIREQDTVTFDNLDENLHRIESAQFGNQNIQPNESYSFTFNSKGTYSYKDTDLSIIGFNGIIEVVDRTEPQKAHNPNYDKIWNYELNSISQPTTIEVTNSKTNYSIEHTKSKNGLLTITTTGETNAEKIKIESSKPEWISFEKNDFTLNSDDQEFVEYTLLPFVSKTEDTNKTYHIDLTIKALNSNQHNITLDIFIPYQEISGDFQNDVEFGLFLLNSFCPLHPCSQLCSPELPQCSSNSQYGNGTGELIINATTQEVKDAIFDKRSTYLALQRLENLIKAFEDKYGIKFEDALLLSNESLVISKESNDIQRSRTTITTIIIFCIVVILCLAYIFTRLNKKGEAESRTADFHKYKE